MTMMPDVSDPAVLVRRRVGRSLLWGACWWFAAVNAWGASNAPTVVVLSWDGVRYDFPDRAAVPGLARMASQGVRAGRLIPVFPANTFPAHVSLATGTYPDRHGIVDNIFVDGHKGRYRMSADADWIEAEPLWIAAERQGVPAATYFWVGSESDWHGRGTRYRVAPFDGDRPEAQKVDQILQWLHLPAEERPRLIMSYWAGTDSVAHDFGPNSGRVGAQLERQDVQLQRLLAGLDALDCWQWLTLLVVSDHGVAAVREYIDLEEVLADAGIRAEVTGSAVAHVRVTDRAEVARAGKVLGALAGLRVYPGNQLPAALRLQHPSRVGDWVVSAAPPVAFSGAHGVAAWFRSLVGSLGWEFGGHGYRPELADMSGVFFAMGRGVPKDVEIAAVHQVDVAATVSRLLGIDPPQHSEGRPVAGIGEHLRPASGDGPDPVSTKTGGLAVQAGR